MAPSTRFLSVVAFAFVAGVASTSTYMSRGDARRSTPEAPHGAAPSTAERLQADAHGQSLPWSDPVKATAVPAAHPRLQFTPGPTDAPVKGVESVASGERGSGPQTTPAPATMRSPDEGKGRPQVRLADTNLHGRPAVGVVPSVKGTRLGSLEAPRPALDSEVEHPHTQTADAARSTQKPHPALSQNLPSLDAVDKARLSARRPEPTRARAPAPSPYRTVRLAGRDDLDAGAPPPRHVREAYAEASYWPFENEPRARSRRSVGASDSLMRWLSGPNGQF